MSTKLSTNPFSVLNEELEDDSHIKLQVREAVESKIPRHAVTGPSKKPNKEKRKPKAIPQDQTPVNAEQAQKATLRDYKPKQKHDKRDDKRSKTGRKQASSKKEFRGKKEFDDDTVSLEEKPMPEETETPAVKQLTLEEYRASQQVVQEQKQLRKANEGVDASVLKNAKALVREEQVFFQSKK